MGKQRFTFVDQLLPGMPLLSYELWSASQLDDRFSDIRLVSQDNAANPLDTKAFFLIASGRSVGRYTIRRHGFVIERNLFWFVPDDFGDSASLPPISSTGVSGSVLNDLFRIVRETIGVFWKTPKKPQVPHKPKFYLGRSHHGPDCISITMLHEMGHVLVEASRTPPQRSATGKRLEEESDIGPRLMALLSAASPNDQLSPLTSYRTANYAHLRTVLHALPKEIGADLVQLRDLLIDLTHHSKRPEKEMLSWEGRFIARSQSKALIQSAACLTTHDPYTFTISGRTISMPSTDIAMLLVAGSQFAWSWDPYCSLLETLAEQVAMVPPPSWEQRDLLLEALHLFGPFVDEHVFRYLKYDTILAYARTNGYDLLNGEEVLILALSMESHLETEIRNLRDLSHDFVDWKDGIYGIIPYLRVCMDLFDAADALLKESEYVHLRETCYERHLALEEKYCDALTTVAHNGVAYQVFLPAVERAFVNGEDIPNVDAPSYQRAEAILRGSHTSRLLTPTFVYRRLADALEALKEKARQSGALYEGPTSIRQVIAVQRTLRPGFDFLRFLKTYRQTQLALRAVVDCNWRFRELLGDSSSLSQYLADAIRDIGGVERFDSSIGAAMLVRGEADKHAH